MTSAGVKVHPTSDTSRQAFGTAAPVMSRQTASEMCTDPDLAKSQNKYVQGDQQKDMIVPPTVGEKTVTDNPYMTMLKEQARFIKENFKQKECICFSPVPNQCGNGKECKVSTLKCHCGEILSMHTGMERKPGKFIFVPREHENILKKREEILKNDLPEPKFKWQASNCFLETTTSAFGKIDFNVQQIGGKKPAKFIRLRAEDSVDKCIELMRDHWHIMEPETPNLVISVVGGAKNFKLDGRNRTIFSTGLIKAAKTTKAWLITSGFNMGVMKSVGQAVHEGQSFQLNNERMSHVLRCIGIAPWGYVKDRQRLTNNDGYKNFTASYRSSTLIEHSKPVPLNEDHTHFIFVDDGFRSRYGGVATFRSEFEKKIKDSTNGGLGIPVVLILVEGGTDAIQDVNASLSQGIPVVICAGTGRAADILAYAFSHTSTTSSKQRVISDSRRETLKHKIAQAYKKEGSELEKLTEEVIKACQQENLMTVFNMKKHGELDLAILAVLLKAQTNSSRESQLKLAMTWNRADIAQEEIFREDAIWKKESLEQSLTEALVEGKVEFVNLLINNGIIMQDYLTTDRLQTLYNSISKNSYLYQILKEDLKTEGFTLKGIGSFLRKLLDRYNEDEMFSEQDKPKLFKRPYKQLLIWAVLMDRWELAHLFLELGEEPITSALICTVLCSGMENKMPKYLSLTKSSFHEMKDEFEKLAVSVLDECHDADPERAIMLVERKSPAWSNLTCLQIAVSVSDKAFVSSAACQNTINNIWKNGIMSSWPKVFISALCPPLILNWVDMSTTGTSKMQNIYSFYTAPLTKFSLYSASYIGFLILFTYMLLVDYNVQPSGTEWASFVWICSFLIGKIHSFLVFPSPTLYGKWRDYLNTLDILDLLNLIAAVIAFGVRWQHVAEGKQIYCINAVIFYIIIMKFYTANRILGPKIYMINRMLQELFKFIMVLAVFLLAYGVASQALLYQQREKSWLILKDIVYNPYWDLYGVITFDDLQTDEECTMAQNGTLTNSLSSCRTYHWLVYLLLALYLLIGNILLLSLLIAIFSHVFETVEENSIEIWKFQMYFLVMEFHNQPLLVPPLSLLFYLFHLLQWIYRRVRCRKRVKTPQFTKRQLEYLLLFEKEMLANKLRPAKANVIYSIEMQYSGIQTRLDEITKMIEDLSISSAPHTSKKKKLETESKDLTQENKMNHKHEKRHKATAGATTASSEENLLGVHVPEGETSQNSSTVSLDESKQASDKETIVPLPQQQTSTFQLSHADKGNFKEIKSGITSGDSANSCQQNELSNDVIKNLEGNKDLVLFEVYEPLPEPSSSPKMPHMKKTENVDNDSLPDDSGDSDDSAGEVKKKRHVPHFGSDLQSRIERASHSNFSNRLSGGLF